MLADMSERLGYLDGWRTDAWTGDMRKVRLTYHTKYGSDGQEWLHLINGPTGSEAAPLLALRNDSRFDSGWLACAGTPERWDTLLVTGESLVRELSDDGI